MKSLLAQDARSAIDWFERGNHFKREGHLSEALDAYRCSIKLNPQVAAPWMGLAQVLDANNQFEEARQCLLQASRIEPGNVLARQLLAAVHKKLGLVQAALHDYQSALMLAPSSASLHYGLGLILEDLGQSAEAALAYRKARAFDPSCAGPLASLLGLGQHLAIDTEIEEAEQRLHASSGQEQALLGYALGKAYDQRNDYQRAFAAFSVANAARRASDGHFQRESFDKRIQDMKQLFSADFFKARKGWGEAASSCPSRCPVFIVGLPRSGTTLTEQILASHPECYGAGELDTLTDLATACPDLLGCGETPWPECAPLLSQEHIAAIAEKYMLSASKRASAGTTRVIDKQPLNFWHLGLVAMALPHARIIHCRRDIRDCGLSIFSQNFSVTQRWSTDLADIAYYWQGYLKLMRHWQEVSGLKFIEVDYEDTVSDIEQQARRILEFVGVPWNAAVLDFHQSDRPVQTPSRWQVRQPLYRTSKQRWLNYQSYLAPLIHAARYAQPEETDGP